MGTFTTKELALTNATPHAVELGEGISGIVERVYTVGLQGMADVVVVALGMDPFVSVTPGARGAQPPRLRVPEEPNGVHIARSSALPKRPLAPRRPASRRQRREPLPSLCAYVRSFSNAMALPARHRPCTELIGNYVFFCKSCFCKQRAKQKEMGWYTYIRHFGTSIRRHPEIQLPILNYMCFAKHVFCKKRANKKESGGHAHIRRSEPLIRRHPEIQLPTLNST